MSDIKVVENFGTPEIKPISDSVVVADDFTALTKTDEIDSYQIIVRGNNIRWYEGLNPTTTDGNVWRKDRQDIISKELFLNLRWIRDNTTDAFIQVTPLRETAQTAYILKEAEVTHTKTLLADVAVVAEEIKPKSVVFDLTNTDSPVEGEMNWNIEDGTVQIGLGGNVNLQLGQEMFLRCKAIGSSITNGQVVYISGASGNNPEVTLADKTTSDTANKVIGVATEDISENSIGYVTTFGLVRDIDTSHAAAGSIIYLTTSGSFDDVKPKQPDYKVRVGYCLRSHATEGVILVYPIQRTNSACNIKRTYLTPTTQTVNTGSLIGGTVTDIQNWSDGNEVEVMEAASIPGFDVEYTISNVYYFCEVLVAFYYVGGSTHDAQVQIYDDTNTTWKELVSQSGAGLSHNLRYIVLPDDSNNYINSSNEVKIRFYHPQSGNASHEIFIDYVAIVGEAV